MIGRRSASRPRYRVDVIPFVDIGPLFGAESSERDVVDAAIIDAASSAGVLSIQAPPDVVAVDPSTRAALLAVFELPAGSQHRLWRHQYAPQHEAVYRGWSPRSAEVAVDIYDLGPDLVRARKDLEPNEDPLLGATPLPDSAELPGWRETTAHYYLAMERVGAAIMGSISRSIGLSSTFFDDAFDGGISTLRLVRYESPPDEPTDEPAERGRPKRGEHVDSGFVTLLVQHGVGGLAVKVRSGDWVDVAPVDGQIVVNFGALLERWTAGRIRATPHRVHSHGVTRCSIPFFYEPRVDAVIAPLPLRGVEPFEPFSYGDHLWAAMTVFPNFTAIRDLRTPRGSQGSLT